VEVGTLVFADYNPRSISPKAMAGLKNSLQQFGLAQPIVVNRRNHIIVGGEQRCRAAIALGWKMVPVAWVDLDPAHERAMNVALNSLELQGEFDQDKLRDLVDAVCLDAVALADELYLKDLLPAVQIKPPTLKKIDTTAPPALAWLLVGVPVEQWMEVAPLCEAAVKIPGAVVETTVTGRKDPD
jgi:ParB-like chromosome segregation protein Spo0J